jgi:hypothetical protein
VHMAMNFSTTLITCSGIRLQIQTLDLTNLKRTIMRTLSCSSYRRSSIYLSLPFSALDLLTDYPCGLIVSFSFTFLWTLLLNEFHRFAHVLDYLADSVQCSRTYCTPRTPCETFGHHANPLHGALHYITRCCLQRITLRGSRALGATCHHRITYIKACQCPGKTICSGG